MNWLRIPLIVPQPNCYCKQESLQRFIDSTWLCTFLLSLTVSQGKRFCLLNVFVPQESLIFFWIYIFCQPVSMRERPGGPKTSRDLLFQREASGSGGGGGGMGNTCKSKADSFQCMTKPTTIL